MIVSAEEPRIQTSLLVHEDTEQTARIVDEAQTRCDLLNAMIDVGVPKSELGNVTCQEFIDRMLFQKHLAQNKMMASEYSAGKKESHLAQVYSLPVNLEHLKDAMERWVHYPVPSRGFNKFLHLKLIDGHYQLDEESLEGEYVMKKVKIYADGDQIARLNELECVVEFFEKENPPTHQILEQSFWNQRLTRDSSQACNKLPHRKFMIKRSYVTGHK